MIFKSLLMRFFKFKGEYDQAFFIDLPFGLMSTLTP